MEGNSMNLINHWGMNWGQFKISYLCFAGGVVSSWSLTQRLQFQIFKFFKYNVTLSLNSLNSVRTFRENSTEPLCVEVRLIDSADSEANGKFINLHTHVKTTRKFTALSWIDPWAKYCEQWLKSDNIVNMFFACILFVTSSKIFGNILIRNTF